MTLAPQVIPLGSAELVEMLVTMRDHAIDLTSATVQVTVADAAAKTLTAPTWLPPDVRSHPQTYSVQAALLIGPGGVNLADGKWRLWMRIVDSPEVPWIPHVRAFRVVS